MKPRKLLIHVNQHTIRSNKINGENAPPICIRIKSRVLLYAHSVNIPGPSRIVYSPDKPLSCGARLWVETIGPVIARHELSWPNGTEVV